MSRIDLTKPETDGFLISADHRQNFTALANALGLVSIVRDGGFKIWPVSDAVSPAHFVDSGSPTIARKGIVQGTLDASTTTTRAYDSGIEATAEIGDIFWNETRGYWRTVTAVDTNYVDLDSAVPSQASGDDFSLIPYRCGDNALHITAGGSEGVVGQTILNTDDLVLGSWKTRLELLEYVSFGCDLWAEAADKVSIYVYDGYTTTRSDYHSGTPGWEWTEVVHPMDPRADRVFVGCSVAAGAVGRFAGLSGLLGGSPPKSYIPCIGVPGLIQITYPGNVTADSDSPNKYQRVTIGRPAFILGISASLSTVSSSGSVTATVYKHTTGNSYSNMLSSDLSIASSAYIPAAHPAFSSYALRCLDGRISLDTPSRDYSEIGTKVTGAGTSATDLRMLIHTLQMYGALEIPSRLGSFGRQ